MNAFLFALLGLLSLGEFSPSAVDVPAAPEAIGDDDPVLLGLLGLAGLNTQLRAALPAEAPSVEGPPPPPAPRALLR